LGRIPVVGNNVMNLNQATMINAVQYYFDNVVFKTGQSPKVISIDPDSKTYNTLTFDVAVETVSTAEKLG
jgi:hypothetical protein